MNGETNEWNCGFGTNSRRQRGVLAFHFSPENASLTLRVGEDRVGASAFLR